MLLSKPKLQELVDKHQVLFNKQYFTSLFAFEKDIKKCSDMRTLDFFSIQFGKNTVDDTSYFFTEFSSVDDIYEQYLLSYNQPSKDYDENGNYTERAIKQLKKCGFKVKAAKKPLYALYYLLGDNPFYGNLFGPFETPEKAMDYANKKWTKDGREGRLIFSKEDESICKDKWSTDDGTGECCFIVERIKK